MPDSHESIVKFHRPAKPAAPKPAPADVGGASDTAATTRTTPVREIGGRKDGTDPTRYGDWEKNGRCIDF